MCNKGEGEYYHSDIRAKAKEGFEVVTTPNFYLGCPEVAIETTTDGTILTYVKNEELK